MTDLAELVDHVIGVDPDRDRVTAAVVSVTTQGELAAATFPATRRGYGQALRWEDPYRRRAPRLGDRVDRQLRRRPRRDLGREGRVRDRVRPPEHPRIEGRSEV